MRKLLSIIWLCTILSFQALAALYFVSNFPLNEVEVRYEEF